MSEKIKFQCTGDFEIKHRGHVKTTVLDRQCDDFDWLIGQTVEIDGDDYLVDGVERFAHTPPYKKGEAIGLLVREIK